MSGLSFARTLFGMALVERSSPIAPLAIAIMLAFGCGGTSIAGDDPHGDPELGAVGGAPNGGAPLVDECLATYPNLELTVCDTLEGYVRVHDAVVVDENGDGRVSPGERLRISVTFSEVSGLTYVAYPGVVFQTLDSGITLDRSGFDGPVSYALGACEHFESVVNATVSPTLEPGSTVRVVARAASLNQDCPNATQLVVAITVDTAT